MIRNLLKKLTFFFWLAPGFLLWASFPPMGECKDAYLALAPLLWLVRQGDVKKSVVRWFLNGFLFWFATLAWMPAIVKNGGPWPLVVLGWGVLATYCALYFAAFGYLATKVWSWVRTRGYGWRLAALVIAEPVLWAGLEIVRARLFGGFAWNQLGVVAVNMGFGAPAQFGGVFLLSAVVILVNGTLASIAERMLGPFLAARRPSVKFASDDIEGYAAEHAGKETSATPAVPSWMRSVETVLPFLLVFALYKVPDYSRPEATRKQALLYARTVEELRKALDETTGEESTIKRKGLILAYMLKFKQICNHPALYLGTDAYRPEDSGKFLVLGEHAAEVASRQEKMLVFTQYREMCEPLADYLATVFGREGLVLHGGTPVATRGRLVKQFQDPAGPPFFVLSVKAAGTGLTLTAANHVLHFDRWWNPAVENQASDRAYRIGQKRNVLIHKFVTPGTLEERIDEMIKAKQGLADALFADGGEKLVTEMSDAELMDLVRLSETPQED